MQTITREEAIERFGRRFVIKAGIPSLQYHQYHELERFLEEVSCCNGRIVIEEVLGADTDDVVFSGEGKWEKLLNETFKDPDNLKPSDLLAFTSDLLAFIRGHATKAYDDAIARFQDPEHQSQRVPDDLLTQLSNKISPQKKETPLTGSEQFSELGVEMEPLPDEIKIPNNVLNKEDRVYRLTNNIPNGRGTNITEFNVDDVIFKYQRERIIDITSTEPKFIGWGTTLKITYIFRDVASNETMEMSHKTFERAKDYFEDAQGVREAEDAIWSKINEAYQEHLNRRGGPA